MLVCIGLEIQLDLIIDLVQMLCWVGIVFSDPENSNSLRLARSKLKFAYLDDCTFDMDFMVYSFPMDEALASVCWTSLLRGSHIAQNFPVLSRPHGAVGLEILIPLLSQICGAERATSFE